jgi:hypothetical protein
MVSGTGTLNSKFKEPAVHGLPQDAYLGQPIQNLTVAKVRLDGGVL